MRPTRHYVVINRGNTAILCAQVVAIDWDSNWLKVTFYDGRTERWAPCAGQSLTICPEKESL